jgi:nucleoside-diphosphate-sugar epimerase
MSKVKILLTGNTGFLGREIFNYFQLENIIHTLSRSFGTYCLDLSLNVACLSDRYDLVIHAAGAAHSVPKNEKDKQKFFSTNLTGTSNLLKGLENSGIPNSFVFISSVSVYGKTEGILINENAPLEATDVYGLSKIEAEEVILNWCKQKNVVCTILRLPLIVGSKPLGNLGSMIKGIQKGYYFNIAGGQGKKSMVLAEDVVKNILKISEIGGIYNLTDGYHPSFSELSSYIAIQLCKGKPMNIPIWLAKIIAKFGDLLGSKAPINTNKLKKITSDLTFDDTKAREAFGWNPTRVLEGFKIN